MGTGLRPRVREARQGETERIDSKGAAEMTATCKTCRWWKSPIAFAPGKPLEYAGSCIRRAPVAIGSNFHGLTELTSRWPLTLQDETCGEHQSVADDSPNALLDRSADTLDLSARATNVGLQLAQETADKPIEELELRTRTENALKAAGINTIGKLLARTADGLLELPGFAFVASIDVRNALRARGLSLAVDSSAANA